MDHIPKVILIIETSRSFGRQILLGISKYSRLNGPWAFYREARDMQSALPHLKNWQADGIIMRNSKVYKQLLSLNAPTILVLHDIEEDSDLPVISTDSAQISKMAAEHLLNKGFKNFAFCGFNNKSWSLQRQENFIQYLEKEGFKTSVFKQSNSAIQKKWEQEQIHMAKWLKNLPKPVGIMACNDDRGQHVLDVCKIAELRVPEDVAVIGVDNDDLICDLCDPPLTSIALNAEKAGYEAAELLDKLMCGEKTDKNIIPVEPTHIISRSSTDLLATEDKEINKAIRYIRQNFRKNIQVSDVVNSTILSRRNLELRFKKSINRSINSEIRRIRVEQICRLLIETEMSISEIAYGLGFSSVEHISRYFKSEIGTNLRDYRRNACTRKLSSGRADYLLEDKR